MIFVSFLRGFQRDWRSRNLVRGMLCNLIHLFRSVRYRDWKSRSGFVELSSLRASIFSYQS